MKSSFFRRVGAYIIDYFIVTLILSIITMGFENNTYLVKETNNLINGYLNEEITIEEYNDKLIDVNYKLQKENRLFNGVSCLLFTGYFVIFAYLNKGQTLGKKIFKIKVASKDGKSLNIVKIFFRALFIYGILSSLYSCIFVNFLNANMFNTGSVIVSYIETFFIVASFLMVLYKKDKRGLHDMIAGTEVLSEKNK